MPICGSYVGQGYGELNINLMQLLQLSKEDMMQSTQVSQNQFTSPYILQNMLLAITEVTIILDYKKYCVIFFQLRWMRPLTFHYIDDQLTSHDELILLQPRPWHGTIDGIYWGFLSCYWIIMVLLWSSTKSGCAWINHILRDSMDTVEEMTRLIKKIPNIKYCYEWWRMIACVSPTIHLLARTYLYCSCSCSDIYLRKICSSTGCGVTTEQWQWNARTYW